MFCGVPYYSRTDAFCVLICIVIFKLKFFVFNNVIFYNLQVVIRERLGAWVIIESTK